MVNRRSPHTPKLTNSGGKFVSSKQLNKSSGRRKCAVRINRKTVLKLLEKQSKNLLDCNRKTLNKNQFKLDRNITMKADLNVENEGMSTPLTRITRKTSKLSLKSPEVSNNKSTTPDKVNESIAITKFSKLSLRSTKKNNEIPSTPTTSKSTADVQRTNDTIKVLFDAEVNTPTTRVTRRKLRGVGNTPRPADKHVEENVSVKECLKPVTRKRGKVDENAPTPAKKKKNEVIKENQGLLSKSSDEEENLNAQGKEIVKRITRKQGILSVKNNESTPMRRITRKSVKLNENESALMKGMEKNKFEEENDSKVREIESSPIKSTMNFDTSKNLSDKEIEDILMEIDEPVNKESGEVTLRSRLPSFKKPTKKETKLLSSSLKIDKSSTKKQETIEDDIYELQVSQPSASETEDMTLFEKLAKEGKVQIKHKRKRGRPQTTGTKKKYLNTSQTWHRIERNIGISPKKLNLIKSKKTNDDGKSTVTNLNKNSNLLNENKQIEHVALIHNEPNAASATTDQSSLEQIECIPNISINTSLPSTSSSSPLLACNVQNFRNKPQIRDKNKLLEFAKNFVSQSTPIAKKQNAAGTGNSVVPLSPILPSSPWHKTTSTNPNDSSHIDSFVSVDFNDSIINSSNAENIPPVPQQQQNRTITSTTTTTENKLTSNLSSKQNTSISTSRQFSKVIGKRNPLKEINVLEVIHLPPLPLRARRIDELSSFKLNENPEAIIPIDDDYNKKKSNEKDTTANYFGFDEIEEIEESADPDKTIDTTIIPQKSHLKRKLQKLQKLLPPIQRNLRNKSPIKKLPLFGETRSKQVKLNEMLNSTMINSSSVPAGGNDETVKNDKIESSDEYNELNESEIPKDTNDTVVDLFGELQDPETTLDSTKIKKTYSRQKKKPRRYFVFFSDNETDSEPEDEQGKKRKKQRKKSDKPEYDKKELNKFAEEFNSMCEEAENYELVKETDNSTLNVAV